MTRLKITIDPLPVLRAAAAAKVSERFNAAAQASLHAELVAIASGRPEAVLARDAVRQQLLAAIEAAATPAAIDAVINGGIQG